MILHVNCKNIGTYIKKENKINYFLPHLTNTVS